MGREWANPFRIGSQNYRILERLRLGPITNYQIVKWFGVLKYTGRLAEIRKAGYKILATKIKGGVWSYQLIQ